MSLITEAIEHPFDIPSKERPPFGDLRLAPLLDAQVEIAAAAGDVTLARSAAEHLRMIADSYPSPSLHACAELADARAALTEGDLDAAISASGTAVMRWADIGAPFETAIARVVLGHALDHAGNHDAARMEWRTAAAAFASYGAGLWAERATQLATPASSATSDPALPVEPTAARFRLDGDLRVVGMGGLTVTLRDLVGFRYMARMLAEPNREFHVLDLVAVEQGTLPVTSAIGTDNSARSAPGAGLPTLDDEARRAYRRRLAEVEEDIDEATRMNDPGRVELAERDKAYLIAELTRAAGLAGRTRTFGGTSERARTAVARSIRYAIARLSEHHTLVARHLQKCISTGTYCAYSPDPLTEVAWELGEPPNEPTTGPRRTSS